MPSILFENNDFIVVNKPCGIEFHGEQGILSKLRQTFPELYGVHRLDKETSGLMLFAKTKKSEQKLKELFSLKKAQKFYLALSVSKPKKKMGLIKGDLEKARGGSFKLCRSLKNPSQTKFISYSLSSFRLFILRPLTGKTHQLRVVCQSLGASILGDQRYKGAQADRMYLHAFRLKFVYENKEYDFSSYEMTGEHSVLLQEFDFSQVDWAYLIK